MSESRGRPEISVIIRVFYGSEETARAILGAISPDNFQAPQGVIIRHEVSNGELSIFVTCSRGIGSMISTVDDLLSCMQAAERALSSVD